MHGCKHVNPANLLVSVSMSTESETDKLTDHETQRDAEGNTVLIVRCKDKNGVYLPCFAFRLDRAELERVYALPLEFIV
jgi:hypothetical protein